MKLDRARGRVIGKYVWHCVVRAAPEDRDRCYDRNVAGYVVKQRDSQASMQAVTMLQQYWNTVAFPNGNKHDGGPQALAKM